MVKSRGSENRAMQSQVLVRLPAELHALLMASAVANSVSGAEQLRMFASEKLTGTKPARRVRRLLAADAAEVGAVLCELGRTGGLLKQLAQAVRLHASSPTLHGEIEATLKQLKTLQARIDGMVDQS